jgi:hypothetical protein
VRHILQSIRSYLTGEKFLPTNDVRFEVVLRDGTVRRIRPGQKFKTGRVSWTVNNRGGWVKLHDPDFKLKKLSRDEMTDEQRKEQDILTFASALVMTLLAGGVVALIIVAVA